MTRSFPLNENRMVSSGVLPIMCFNCLKRVGVVRTNVFAGSKDIDARDKACSQTALVLHSTRGNFGFGAPDTRAAAWLHAMTNGSKTYSARLGLINTLSFLQYG
jgi:hypothetical protein